MTLYIDIKRDRAEGVHDDQSRYCHDHIHNYGVHRPAILSNDEDLRKGMEGFLQLFNFGEFIYQDKVRFRAFLFNSMVESFFAFYCRYLRGGIQKCKGNNQNKIEHSNIEAVLEKLGQSFPNAPDGFWRACLPLDKSVRQFLNLERGNNNHFPLISFLSRSQGQRWIDQKDRGWRREITVKSLRQKIDVMQTIASKGNGNTNTFKIVFQLQGQYFILDSFLEVVEAGGKPLSSSTQKGDIELIRWDCQGPLKKSQKLKDDEKIFLFTKNVQSNKSIELVESFRNHCAILTLLKELSRIPDDGMIRLPYLKKEVLACREGIMAFAWLISLSALKKRNWANSVADKYERSSTVRNQMVHDQFSFTQRVQDHWEPEKDCVWEEFLKLAQKII